MGLKGDTRRHRRQRGYDKQVMDPAHYLAVKRIHLISRLPADACLRGRVEKNGRLRPIQTGHPDISRKASTEEDHRNIQSRGRSDPIQTGSPDISRKASTEEDHRNIQSRGRSDPLQTGPPDLPRKASTEEGLRNIQGCCRLNPDCAITRLQRSQLVSMWNADNVSEDQWREYDGAEPIMRVLRVDSGIPQSRFHSDKVVGEKRKRIVSAGYQKPSTRRLWPETAAELEWGEEEELEEAFGSTETPEEMNVRLLHEDAALGSVLPGRAPPDTPPSPPGSDESGDSDDDEEAAWAMRAQALKEWVAESEGSNNASPRPPANTALDPALQGMSALVRILEEQVEDEQYD